MIIPIRCFSCGNVIADKWERFVQMTSVEQESIESALDDLKVTRYCCRRMFVSHVQLIDEVAPFSTHRQ